MYKTNKLEFRNYCATDEYEHSAHSNAQNTEIRLLAHEFSETTKPVFMAGFYSNIFFEI